MFLQLIRTLFTKLFGRRPTKPQSYRTLTTQFLTQLDESRPYQWRDAPIGKVLGKILFVDGAINRLQLDKELEPTVWLKGLEPLGIQTGSVAVEWVEQVSEDYYWR